EAFQERYGVLLAPPWRISVGNRPAAPCHPSADRRAQLRTGIGLGLAATGQLVVHEAIAHTSLEREGGVRSARNATLQPTFAQNPDGGKQGFFRCQGTSKNSTGVG